MSSPQTQPESQREPPERTDQAEQAPAPEAPTERREPGGGKVVHLHTVHPRVPIPYVTPGDMFSNVRATTSALPSPRKLAYYGLLGGMAVVGALEWPIAIAIGAATEVVTREQARRRTDQEQREQPATEPSARTEEPAGTAQTSTA